MRDILKNLNDALEGPEVESERWYKLWECGANRPPFKEVMEAGGEGEGG